MSHWWNNIIHCFISTVLSPSLPIRTECLYTYKKLASSTFNIYCPLYTNLKIIIIDEKDMIGVRALYHTDTCCCKRLWEIMSHSVGFQLLQLVTYFTFHLVRIWQFFPIEKRLYCINLFTVATTFQAKVNCEVLCDKEKILFLTCYHVYALEIGHLTIFIS